MPEIYCVDGNIGAGKTSVLDELEGRGFCVFREDLSSWEWCLEKYYANPKKWAFVLQSVVICSMLSQKKIIDSLETGMVFIERCPRSSMIFVRTLLKRGFLTSEEYTDLYDTYNRIAWHPTLTFMLDTPADICFERMTRRGRDCEKQIELSYLHDLAGEYEKYRSGCTMINHDQSVQEIADEILTKIK